MKSRPEMKTAGPFGPAVIYPHSAHFGAAIKRLVAVGKQIQTGFIRVDFVDRSIRTGCVNGK
ncbi:MAG: hypothetical protein P8X43_03705, partial [Maritimibacter sp.]